MTPGFINHLLLICQFELARLLKTRRGLLYLITFAIVWYFILLYPIRFSSDLISQNSTQGSSFFRFIGFDSLLSWHIPEFGVYWHFALIIFPILCIFTSSDQTCSDRERGTLRFLALRASRDSLFFGRFAGVMATQILLIVITLLSTLAIVLFRDFSLLTAAFNSSTAILINLIIIILPFNAMMAALSTSVNSARQATVWAILIWSFLTGIISLLASYLPALDILKMLIPGYQMPELSKLAEWQGLSLSYIPMLQTLLILVAGNGIIRRQAL